MVQVTIKGLKELQAAIKRNPRVVEGETSDFIQRGLHVYNTIMNQSSPWRIGQSGGGIPVRTGNLKERHITERDKFSGRIRPIPSYAVYVHEGTVRMKKRPWLDYAVKRGQKDVDRLAEKLLERITKNLAN